MKPAPTAEPEEISSLPPDAPRQPKPGDPMLGWQHRPNPHRAHVFLFANFEEPNGKPIERIWVFLCRHCELRRQQGTPLESLLEHSGRWPEGEPPLVYEKLS
jgi:hypothetical protein